MRCSFCSGWPHAWPGVPSGCWFRELPSRSVASQATVAEHVASLQAKEREAAAAAQASQAVETVLKSQIEAKEQELMKLEEAVAQAQVSLLHLASLHTTCLYGWTGAGVGPASLLWHTQCRRELPSRH